MCEISIIIPTLNRADSLERTLYSIAQLYSRSVNFEVIVVDNGSSDSTKEVVQKIKKSSHFVLKYYYEPAPGMHSARHKGAVEAEGRILTFIDDDVLLYKFWLKGIIEAFEDQEVHLVGGPSLGKLEVPLAPWVAKYCKIREGCLELGALSLLDLGSKVKEVDPEYIWGLNFSVRKKTYFELGGFNPDCIAKELQHFQGDGETGFAKKIRAAGYKALYVPRVKVHHCIPKSRLTVQAFKDRLFYQGVCDSYTKIRKNGTLNVIEAPKRKELSVSSTYNEEEKYLSRIHYQIDNSYVDGFEFHQQAVARSNGLLAWILKENYFDYKLPDLSTELSLEDSTILADGRIAAGRDCRLVGLRKDFKIAILSNRSNSFVKPISEGLQRLLGRSGLTCDLFYDGKSLLSPEQPKEKVKEFLTSLSVYDAVIYVSNLPCAFWGTVLDDELLRSELANTPIILYDTKFFGSLAGWSLAIQSEMNNLGAKAWGLDRYDYYLAISASTSWPMLSGTLNTVSLVGVDLDDGTLFPKKKDDFVALIDFERKDHLQEKQLQIEACEETDTPYIILEGSYSIDEIREIYRKCSLYFVAHVESFGLPICELQACGAYVASPKSIWCRGHWQKEDLTRAGDGVLNDNFIVYGSDKEKLKQEILRLKTCYDPYKVYNEFAGKQPELFWGNKSEVENFIGKLCSKEIDSNTHENYLSIDQIIEGYHKEYETK